MPFCPICNKSLCLSGKKVIGAEKKGTLALNLKKHKALTQAQSQRGSNPCARNHQEWKFGGGIISAKCGHLFHQNCLNERITTFRTRGDCYGTTYNVLCPLCGANISNGKTLKIDIEGHFGILEEFFQDLCKLKYMNKELKRTLELEWIDIAAIDKKIEETKAEYEQVKNVKRTNEQRCAAMEARIAKAIEDASTCYRYREIEKQLLDENINLEAVARRMENMVRVRTNASTTVDTMPSDSTLTENLDTGDRGPNPSRDVHIDLNNFENARLPVPDVNVNDVGRRNDNGDRTRNELNENRNKIVKIPTPAFASTRSSEILEYADDETESIERVPNTLAGEFEIEAWNKIINESKAKAKIHAKIQTDDEDEADKKTGTGIEDENELESELGPALKWQDNPIRPIDSQTIQNSGKVDINLQISVHSEWEWSLSSRGQSQGQGQIENKARTFQSKAVATDEYESSRVSTSTFLGKVNVNGIETTSTSHSIQKNQNVAIRTAQNVTKFLQSNITVGQEQSQGHQEHQRYEGLVSGGDTGQFDTELDFEKVVQLIENEKELNSLVDHEIQEGEPLLIKDLAPLSTSMSMPSPLVNKSQSYTVQKAINSNQKYGNGNNQNFIQNKNTLVIEQEQLKTPKRMAALTVAPAITDLRAQVADKSKSYTIKVHDKDQTSNKNRIHENPDYINNINPASVKHKPPRPHKKGHGQGQGYDTQEPRLLENSVSQATEPCDSDTINQNQMPGADFDSSSYINEVNADSQNTITNQSHVPLSATSTKLHHVAQKLRAYVDQQTFNITENNNNEQNLNQTTITKFQDSVTSSKDYNSIQQKVQPTVSTSTSTSTLKPEFESKSSLSFDDGNSAEKTLETNSNSNSLLNSKFVITPPPMFVESGELKPLSISMSRKHGKYEAENETTSKTTEITTKKESKLTNPSEHLNCAQLAISAKDKEKNQLLASPFELVLPPPPTTSMDSKLCVQLALVVPPPPPMSACGIEGDIQGQRSTSLDSSLNNAFSNFRPQSPESTQRLIESLLGSSQSQEIKVHSNRIYNNESDDELLRSLINYNSSVNKTVILPPQSVKSGAGDRDLNLNPAQSPANFSYNQRIMNNCDLRPGTISVAEVGVGVQMGSGIGGIPPESAESNRVSIPAEFKCLAAERFVKNRSFEAIGRNLTPIKTCRIPSAHIDFEASDLDFPVVEANETEISSRNFTPKIIYPSIYKNSQAQGQIQPQLYEDSDTNSFARREEPNSLNLNRGVGVIFPNKDQVLSDTGNFCGYLGGSQSQCQRMGSTCTSYWPRHVDKIKGNGNVSTPIVMEDSAMAVNVNYLRSNVSSLIIDSNSNSSYTLLDGKKSEPRFCNGGCAPLSAGFLSDYGISKSWYPRSHISSTSSIADHGTIPTTRGCIKWKENEVYFPIQGERENQFEFS